MRVGLCFLAAALGGCLLQPSDEAAQVSFTLDLGGSPLPAPSGDASRDGTGRVLLDTAGLHLWIEVRGEGIDPPLVAELVPGPGEAPASEPSVTLSVPAGPARSFDGVAYLRTGEAGTDRTDAGAEAFVAPEPLVRPLVEGESIDLELALQLAPTGTLAGTIARQLDVTRPDVTHVALVDLDTDTVLPWVATLKQTTAEETTFSYQIRQVPVGRRFALRLRFLDATVQDIPETEFTLDARGDDAVRNVQLEDR